MKLNIDGVIVDSERLDAYYHQNHINRYMAFIRRFGTEDKPKEGYVEHHHVVFNKINPDAKIYLSHRGHMIAHWMLHRIFQTRESACAWHLSAAAYLGRRGARETPNEGMRQRINKAMSEYSKGELNPNHGRSPWNKGLPMSPEQRAKMQYYYDNKPKWTDEQRAAYSKLRKSLNMKISPEAKMKSSMTQSGKGNHYIYTDPNGGKHYVFNPSWFCKQNGISHSHMRGVATGKRSHHKGWTARLVFAYEKRNLTTLKENYYNAPTATQ